jgi:hypothetical protein
VFGFPPHPLALLSEALPSFPNGERRQKRGAFPSSRGVHADGGRSGRRDGAQCWARAQAALRARISVRHSSLKIRSGSIPRLFTSFRTSGNVSFGAKYVSTIIRTTASAASTTAELDRTRIWLINAYTLTNAATSASSCGRWRRLRCPSQVARFQLPERTPAHIISSVVQSQPRAAEFRARAPLSHSLLYSS